MAAKILIVDDHEAVRAVLDGLLTHAGYDCMTTSSGETALEMCRRLKFDLAVLDVNMPRMNGLEVLSVMKARVPAVIMVTADNSSDTVRSAVALGCAGYVAKPIEPALLIARVQRLLARRGL